MATITRTPRAFPVSSPSKSAVQFIAIADTPYDTPAINAAILAASTIAGVALPASYPSNGDRLLLAPALPSQNAGLWQWSSLRDKWFRPADYRGTQPQNCTVNLVWPGGTESAPYRMVAETKVKVNSDPHSWEIEAATSSDTAVEAEFVASLAAIAPDAAKPNDLRTLPDGTTWKMKVGTTDASDPDNWEQDKDIPRTYASDLARQARTGFTPAAGEMVRVSIPTGDDLYYTVIDPAVGAQDESTGKDSVVTTAVPGIGLVGDPLQTVAENVAVALGAPGVTNGEVIDTSGDRTVNVASFRLWQAPNGARVEIHALVDTTVRVEGDAVELLPDGETVAVDVIALTSGPHTFIRHADVWKQQPVPNTEPIGDTIVIHPDGTTLELGRINQYPNGTVVSVAGLGDGTGTRIFSVTLPPGQQVTVAGQTYTNNRDTDQPYTFKFVGVGAVERMAVSGEDILPYAVGQEIFSEDAIRSIAIPANWSGEEPDGAAWQIRIKTGVVVPFTTTGDPSTTAGLEAMLAGDWELYARLPTPQKPVRWPGDGVSPTIGFINDYWSDETPGAMPTPTAADLGNEIAVRIYSLASTDSLADKQAAIADETLTAEPKHYIVADLDGAGTYGYIPARSTSAVSLQYEQITTEGQQLEVGKSYLTNGLGGLAPSTGLEFGDTFTVLNEPAADTGNTALIIGPIKNPNLTVSPAIPGLGIPPALETTFVWNGAAWVISTDTIQTITVSDSMSGIIIRTGVHYHVRATAPITLRLTGNAVGFFWLTVASGTDSAITVEQFDMAETRNQVIKEGFTVAKSIGFTPEHIGKTTRFLGDLLNDQWIVYREWQVSGNPTTHIPLAELSPADPLNPSEAEVAAWATDLSREYRDRLLYFTNSDTATDTKTHLFWVDRMEVVTLLRAPDIEPVLGLKVLYSTDTADATARSSTAQPVTAITAFPDGATVNQAIAVPAEVTFGTTTLTTGLWYAKESYPAGDAAPESYWVKVPGGAVSKGWKYSTDGMNAADGDKVIVAPNHTINLPSTTDLDEVLFVPSTGNWRDIQTGTGGFSPDAGWTFGNGQTLSYGSDVMRAIAQAATTNWLLVMGGEDVPESEQRYEAVADLPSPATVNSGRMAVVYNDPTATNNRVYVARGPAAGNAIAWS